MTDHSLTPITAESFALRAEIAEREARSALREANRKLKDIMDDLARANDLLDECAAGRASFEAAARMEARRNV